MSIETDLPSLPGLPPHASPVDRRIDAARALRDKGVRTVATLSPLLPIGAPEQFMRKIQGAFDAIVIDHFIGGDGSMNGARTLRTELPRAMVLIEPASVTLAYRDQIVGVARRFFEQVGVGCDGFAGRFLPPVIGSRSALTNQRTTQRSCRRG